MNNDAGRKPQEASGSGGRTFLFVVGKGTSPCQQLLWHIKGKPWLCLSELTYLVSFFLTQSSGHICFYGFSSWLHYMIFLKKIYRFLSHIVSIEIICLILILQSCHTKIFIKKHNETALSQNKVRKLGRRKCQFLFHRVCASAGTKNTQWGEEP